MWVARNHEVNMLLPRTLNLKHILNSDQIPAETRFIVLFIANWVTCLSYSFPTAGFMFTSLLPPRQRGLRVVPPANNHNILFSTISNAIVESKRSISRAVMCVCCSRCHTKLWYCEIGNSCKPAAIHGGVVLLNQARAQFPVST